MRHNTEELQQFIIDNLKDNHRVIARITAEHFGISRAAVAKHLQALIAKKWLKAKGVTKARTYHLLPLKRTSFELPVTKHLEEDVIWREQVSPLLANNVPENILTICNYGFTEMLNNVKDHSESDRAKITIGFDAADVRMTVQDFGIGIFAKLMRDFKLHDPRHALLELSKGKLTSDATKHSGQGIFFTSRMFDEFILDANDFSYCRFNKDDEWLFEISEEMKGTCVTMVISRRSTRTASNVLEEYSSELHDYGFTKTHVPLELARYEGEQLVSRSQAKRLLARIDQFKEVILDFKGIKTIGQAFADEIFRVFTREHPNVIIVPINVNEEVGKRIEGAQKEDVQTPTLPLFEDGSENR